MKPVLEPFVERHAEEFAAAVRRSRSLHGRWVNPPTDPSAVAELATRRSGPLDFGYIVCDGDTGRLAGFIAITNIVRGSLQSGYVGYYAFKGFERQGYMKWGLAAVVRRAWKIHKLHRLEAGIQPDNVASLALVRALGFRREGFSPRYVKIRGRWRDHERWAILSDDSREAPIAGALSALDGGDAFQVPTCPFRARVGGNAR